MGGLIRHGVLRIMQQFVTIELKFILKSFFK